LKEKLLAVQKIRELIALGKEYNFELDEVETLSTQRTAIRRSTTF